MQRENLQQKNGLKIQISTKTTAIKNLIFAIATIVRNQFRFTVLQCLLSVLLGEPITRNGYRYHSIREASKTQNFAGAKKFPFSTTIQRY
jgi:hypothetical protein